MLRLSPAKLARLEPASTTEFGHLLETFVVGEKFRAGIILTTGEHSGRLEDRIFTCPIDRLWLSHT